MQNFLLLTGKVKNFCKIVNIAKLSLTVERIIVIIPRELQGYVEVLR